MAGELDDRAPVVGHDILCVGELVSQGNDRLDRLLASFARRKADDAARDIVFSENLALVGELNAVDEPQGVGAAPQPFPMKVLGLLPARRGQEFRPLIVREQGSR